MSTHGPVEEQYRVQMLAICATIDQFLNPDSDNKTIAFALIMAPFEDPGRCNYMSNAQREDMLQLLKEFVARAEGMHPEELN